MFVCVCDDTCKKREKSKREKVEKMEFEWGYFLKANFEKIIWKAA